MLELTGVASVPRGISLLYWLVAIGALALVIWKLKKWWGKAIGAIVVLGVFSYVPASQLLEASKREAYAREAWVYFKKKCATEAGEKIQKTYTGVKSVVVVKALPPATEKDIFDQYWYGDPYSDAVPLGDQRGVSTAVRLLGSLASRGIKPKTVAESTGFDYVEMSEPQTGDGPRYIRITQPNPKDWPVRTVIDKPASQFAIAWEDISTPTDRKYWVAGSRLRVIDLRDNSIVAERIGFLIEPGFGATVGQRRPWLTGRGPKTTCPVLTTLDYDDRLFVQRVLNPVGEERHGK